MSKPIGLGISKQNSHVKQKGSLTRIIALNMFNNIYATVYAVFLR